MISKNQSLREQNELLRRKIEQFQKQKLSVENIDGQIKKFIQESEKNVSSMTQKINEQNAAMNKKLHDLTGKYESILKNQITLLTKNKELNQRKQKQDEVFNERVQKMTVEYEAKIKDFQTKVKGNVKKIKQISQANVIKKLLKSEKFKTEIQKKGIKIQVLQKQCQLEDIISGVQQKQTQINELQTRSQDLDEQLTKMRELIETMKELLQNMVKQKQNIVKQNAILKEKLKQSEQLIGKLLGGVGQAEGEEQQYDEDFEQQQKEGEADGQQPKN